MFEINLIASVVCYIIFKDIFICFVQQMDDAVYTFEQLLHQSLEDQEGEDLCKTIQRCQDRVIKVKQEDHLPYHTF